MSLGEKYVIRTTVAGERKLRKLTAYDRAAIMREVRKAQKADLIENLKAAGVDDKELFFNELRAFDSKEIKQADFIGYINSLDGQAAVISRSLDELPEDERARAQSELAIPHAELMELVCELCGLQIVTSAVDVTPNTSTYGDGSEPENPTTAPDTYESPTPTKTT